MGGRVVFLKICRLLGLFAAARRATRRSLRVLCFHAFAQADEFGFWPGVFLDPAIFRRRLDYLREHGYEVVPLDEAVNRLDGEFDRATVVITMDDGFVSSATVGGPILREFGYPATLYVCSYYSKYAHPVFGVCLQYMFWRTRKSELTLRDHWTDAPEPLYTKGDAGRRHMRMLLDYGREALDEPSRNELLAVVADRLDVDLEAIVRQRLFSNLTASELRELPGHGIDVQLHTHRHRFPVDAELADYEIRRNREFLTDALGPDTPNAPLVHFCYPSGEWSEEHFPVLVANGIRSATTLERGLNPPGSHPYALRRINETGRKPDVVFAAEVSGFLHLARQLRDRVRARTGLTAAVRTLRADIDTRDDPGIRPSTARFDRGGPGRTRSGL
jgi:peptidoglycan/xylan/chitin deacetylase (PgdA/CDA1 family)